MEGLYHSMRMALDSAGLYPDQISYLCANACSDMYGDQAEVDAIKRLFGKHAYRMAVGSIRGVTGHPLAPAGLFQIIASILMLRSQVVCPTANLTRPDPGCDLDHVPLEARRSHLEVTLASGHGMGGENSSIVLGRI